MNYIYDILVNFSEMDIFEFFEWDNGDNIEHLRRIPIFKVNSKTLKDFKFNIIKIDKEFIIKLKNRTEVFSNKYVNYIEYSAIFTDGADLIVIEFDKNGECILKGSMLLDEEQDTLSESENINEIKINYKVINYLNKIEFLTRNQKNILKYIKKELDYLLKHQNYNKLKYLYYEWYNKKTDDIISSIDDILNILNLEFCEKHVKLFDVIKLSNMKKQL